MEYCSKHNNKHKITIMHVQKNHGINIVHVQKHGTFYLSKYWIKQLSDYVCVNELQTSGEQERKGLMAMSESWTFRSWSPSPRVMPMVAKTRAWATKHNTWDAFQHLYRCPENYTFSYCCYVQQAKDRADYVRYETKSQLSNLVILREIKQ